MNRSKREIKTPKRFDDEPFDSPRMRLSHQQQPPPPPQLSEPPSIKAEPGAEEPNVQFHQQLRMPEQVQIKLPSAKAHATKQQTAKGPHAKSQLTPKTTPEPKSIIKVKLTRTKPSVALPTSPPPKLSPVSHATPGPKPKPKPTPTQRAPPGPKPAVRVSSAERKAPGPRTSLTSKNSQAIRPQEVTKEIVNFPRPKKERPRTPPAFADLIPNVVLPFWDARTAAEEHEDDNVKELVHCHCGIPEELGLMVQCETCLTWQHANCLGIERPEDAPDGYTCRACSDPKFARESMRWAYDQDWLVKGRMKQFSCDPNITPVEDIRIFYQVNQLIGDALNVNQLIHSLRVKSRILMNAPDDDPELKLFRIQWPSSYQHRDGTTFVPPVSQPSDTPASTISVMAETPDPCDIPVETVVEARLPDIGQLEDVSAILDNTDIPNSTLQPMIANHEATPNGCRANLKLHIQQSEEFLAIELSRLESRLEALEKECASRKKTNGARLSIESLRNDLHTMRKIIEHEEGG